MKDIVYLRHAEIDKRKWDAALRRSANAMVYGYSWYLDLVSPQWDALVAGDYTAVMPLTWRRKAGIRYLCQPPFTQQLGVFSAKDLSSKEIAAFLQAIPSTFRYLDIFLNTGNHMNPDSKEKVLPRLTHHLPLQPAAQKTAKNYSENLRRNLSKAERQALKADVTGIGELIKMFRAERGKQVGTLGNKEYALLKKLVTVAEARGLVTLTGIRKQGRLVAGACFLASDHEYIFFFSATNTEGRKTGAMSFLVDRFLQEHSGEPMHLDFEGSMDKNLARFYKSFGAHEIVYLHIQSNRLPRLVRWLKP